VGYWASTQSTQTQEFRQESGTRNQIQVSGQPDPSSWFLSHARSVQLQQQARLQNTGRTPVQIHSKSDTSPERTHIMSTVYFIFSLFRRITVNTLQPHPPSNVEQSYNRHNQYNTSKGVSIRITFDCVPP
jgi:hypothetical protein